MNVILILIIAIVGATLPTARANPSAELGSKIFGVETAGGKTAPANSCMYCHGANGDRGAVVGAANLTKPKDWKSFKALGGETQLKKNAADFSMRLEDAVSNVILVGAIRHNMTYKKAGYDLTKAGGPLNVQMLGLTGAPTSAYLKKNDLPKDVAVRSLLLYLKTLDRQGVFQK